MDSYTLFTKTPPLRLFFFAALPGAVSMLASALYGLIDGIFVGRILGETPFAALNLAMPFVIINFALADLIGVGSSVPISIALGRKREDHANNIFSSACLLILAAGVLTGAVLYAAAPSLIALMGAEGDFAAQAVQYLRVYALCSPVTTIVFALDNYLRICGKVRYSMFLNILMSVASVVAEFLLLYVFRWGIQGAALGTCLGMMVCALLGLVPFLTGKLQLRFVRPRLSWDMIRQIVSCGAPNFLNNIAGRLTSILMNMLLVRLGGERAVSIYGILMYVEGVIQPLLYGMCDSLQPAVGFNWGAQKYSRVRAIEKCCYTASAAVSVISAAVIMLIPGFIARLFLADAGGVIPDAVFALRLFSLTYVTRWLSFATQSYMLAVEKALPASVLSIATVLVFPLLLILALWPLGLTGIWLNLPLTSALSGVLALLILKRLRGELSQPDAQN